MSLKKDRIDQTALYVNGFSEAKDLTFPETSLVIEKAVPDPEVKTALPRRNFTAHYKLKILEEVEHCEEGKIASVLRREGLYSSHLTKWRRQRKKGSLRGLHPRKRGKPAKVVDASLRRIAELEKVNARLAHRLQQAELIIDVQKKVSAMFGVCVKPAEDKRKTS